MKVFKKSFVVLVAILLLLLVIIFGSFRYYNFLGYRNNLQSGVFMDMPIAFYEYTSLFNTDSIDIIQFEDYIKNEQKFAQLHEKFGKLNFGFIDINDSILIYEYGYDHKDDHGLLLYSGKNVGFLKSFFIKGDIQFLKLHKTNLNSLNIETDKPKPPPFPPPSE